MSANTNKLVTLGRISGVFGVKGWLKVRSYTEPAENIVGYAVWTLRRDAGVATTVAVEEGRRHGRSVVAKLRGVDDVDRARAWIGADVAVERAELPQCAPGEFYWADLEGLEVRTAGGELLGRVDHLLAAGAHDVLVLAGGDRERLIPFVLGSVIREVDLEAGRIIADWSAED